MFRRFAIVLVLGEFFVLALSAHASSSVIINEIQTGGTDADDEFIELWNGSDAAVALEDWSLQYKSATGTTITKRNFEKGAAIPAQGYYLIATKEYKGATTPDFIQATINLAKSGGNFFLVRNQEAITSKDDPDIVDRVAWGTGDSAEGSATAAPDSGQSIERSDGADTNNNASDFTSRATPTPSNTKTASSSQPSATAAPTTAVSTPPPAEATSDKKTAPVKIKEEKADLTITELLPNPVGSDDREFIELQNTGTASVALAGWRLTNRLGQEYRFTEGTLASKEYILLWREKSKLALQNEREEIRLFSPGKERASETVKWSDAPEGSALMRDEHDDLVWTTTPSPGAANALMKERQSPHIVLDSPKEGSVGDLLAFDASDSFDPEGEPLAFQWDFGDALGTAEGNRVSYIYFKSGTFTVTLAATDKEGLTATASHKIKINGENLLAPLPSLRGSENDRSNPKTNSKKTTASYEIVPPQRDPAKGGDFITLTSRDDTRKTPLASGTIHGIVTVPPGVLAKTYMYVTCEAPCAGEGVKVRMTKANWPTLQKGDVVIMNGKASTAGNEPSFLVKKENVQVTGARKHVTPEPLPSFREMDDALLRHFVIATGEITEKKSRLLYLDDGTGELSVAAKSSPLIAEGDKISIAGILTKNEKGYAMKASEPATVINAEPKVAKTSMQIVRDKDSERTKYLVTTLAALLAIGARPIFLFIQKRRKKIDVMT